MASPPRQITVGATNLNRQFEWALPTTGPVGATTTTTTLQPNNNDDKDNHNHGRHHYHHHYTTTTATTTTNELCTSRFTNAVCLPRNLHFEVEVHKALPLPRNLHFEVHCACHEICTSRFASAVPATKSALRRPPSAVTATKSANEPHVQKSRFTAPVTKSELLDDHHHVQSVAPATKTAKYNSSDPLHLSRKVDLEEPKREVSPAPATKCDRRARKCARRHNESAIVRSTHLGAPRLCEPAQSKCIRHR